MDKLEMEQSFLKFLREQRRLDEKVVSTFINEKIDCYAVDGMSDDELMRYVPKIGDRIAIRQYCRREVAALEGTSSAVSKATESLMAKLKQRRGSKRSHDDDRSEKLTGNSNAFKNVRTYQMGLFEEVGFFKIQIKEKRWGGTRHLHALKTSTMAELLEIGKELFFPNSQIYFFHVNEFEFTMRDFTEVELDPSTTLGKQYEIRKVKLLRLYLSCKRTDTAAGETVNAATSPGESQNATASRSETPSTTAFTSETPSATALASETLNAITYLSTENYNRDIVFNTPSLFVEDVMLLTDETQASISIDEEIQIGYTFLQDDSAVLDDTLPLDLDPVHVESLFTAQELRQPPKITKLRLHRGNVFQELNVAFKDGRVSVDDSLLEVEMVLPNGTKEKGEDNGGVLLDALSEYWETFVLKCTTGNMLKIPMTRHDMKDEWENVAKVMVLGYNMVKYFPIVLAKPFLSYCLGLEIMDDDLFSTFLETVPTEEKEVAEQAIKDFKSISGREEWLEFLEAHDVKLRVTEENVRKTLLEVAHKEMEQDPAYIADSWSTVLKGLKLPPEGLDEVMSSLTPTTRKVAAMLQHETLNKREHQIWDFLKKFIRNCSEVRLRKFLRFCTGADLLVAKAIHVQFVEPKSSFTRCPQSHTCGCVLEVPNNYMSYLELAEDFTSLP